jgi:hypothetical protein
MMTAPASRRQIDGEPHEPMPPLHHQAAIAMRHDRLADSVLGMLLIAASSIAG